MKKDTAKHSATMLDFKYEYEAEKRKDEHAICTKFDTIASALYSQRRFWEMWNYQDGPVQETYKDVCKIFSDRAKRMENKRQLSNPEAHAKQIDKNALAYADAQIRKGSDLIYNIWHCNTYIYIHMYRCFTGMLTRFTGMLTTLSDLL